MCEDDANILETEVVDLTTDEFITTTVAVPKKHSGNTCDVNIDSDNIEDNRFDENDGAERGNCLPLKSKVKKVCGIFAKKTIKGRKQSDYQTISGSQESEIMTANIFGSLRDCDPPHSSYDHLEEEKTRRQQQPAVVDLSIDQSLSGVSGLGQTGCVGKSVISTNDLLKSIVGVKDTSDADCSSRNHSLCHHYHLDESGSSHKQYVHTPENDFSESPAVLNVMFSESMDRNVPYTDYTLDEGRQGVPLVRTSDEKGALNIVRIQRIGNQGSTNLCLLQGDYLEEFNQHGPQLLIVAGQCELIVVRTKTA